MRFVTATIAMAAVIGGVFACAGDVELVDRTQPNKVKKSIFNPDDAWFFRTSVIETQFNQGLLFEGLEGEMERIRWRIEKDQLIAYRSYEWLEDAEQGTGATRFEGAPIAVFAITSHFDILRGYNPATGEQDNILAENTTDRPWYERAYMRVDWSQNLLRNPYTIEGFVTAVGGAPHYVQEHEVDNPYRSEIAENNINIVQNYLLTTDIETCYYTFLDPYFCGTSEAKIKLSFMKVAQHDYEVLYYPDVQVLRREDGAPIYKTCYVNGTCEKATVQVFERFGFFRHERRVYDHEYQWTRDGRVFVGHRRSIWKRTRDLVGKRIPPAYRQPDQIVYYTNVDFPSGNDANGDGMDDTLWTVTAATQEDVDAGRTQRMGLVPDWDVSFRETVASLKRQEPAYADTEAGDVPPILVVKRNGCNLVAASKYAVEHGYKGVLREFGISEIQPGNLERACALLEWASDGEFTWQKSGDLRYSFINWVDEPEAAGPLGYGPHAADPVTGEIISSSANVYGGAIEELSAYAADAVSLMNGELQVDELIQGGNVREHMRASRARTRRDLSRDKMAIWRDRMLSQGGDSVPGDIRMRWDDNHHHLVFDRESIEAAKQTMLVSASRTQTRLERLKGTAIEKELLLNDDLKRAILGPDRFQPGQPLSGELADFSLMDWMSTELRDKHQQTLIELGRRAILMKDWADPGMVSLALELEGKTWEEVYEWMRREIYRSVTTHEVGHTLGLRHNFRGSIDPLNYGPEFWSHYQYDASTGVGSVNKEAGADQHMYSSIMDYSARFYADSVHGIGLYDMAAIKFGYGLLVEVFDEDMAYSYKNFLNFYDYVDFPRVFGNNLQCYNNSTCSHADALAAAGQNGYCSQEDRYEAQAIEAERAGDWASAAELWNQHDVALELCDRYLNTYLLKGLEGSVPRPENINRRRDMTWDEYVEAWTRYWLGQPTSLPDEVPYKYCPDEYASWTWVECKPWDKGANFVEVTRDRMERYDAYYFFTNFKRDRAEFNDSFYANRYLQRLYQRYFSQMSNAFIYGLYGGSFVGYDKNGHRIVLSDFSMGSDWQAAGLEGMNFLVSILEQPEPGNYCYDPADPRNFVQGAQTGYQSDGVQTLFSGMRLRQAPLEAGTLTIHLPDGQVLTDNGAGQVRTDTSVPVGTIDYASGALEMTFSSAPAVGPITADYGTQVFRADCDSGTTIEVPLGAGKHYYTTWTDEYHYKATRLGTFFDKWAAIYALTDNEGFFYRDFASYFDVGAFSLSYWSGGLKDEMLDLFSSAFSGGTGRYAWRYDENGSDMSTHFLPVPVVDIYDEANNDESLFGMPRIESASSWTLRWYAVTLPMLRYSDMFDYTADFINYARVCLEGYSDCLGYDASVGHATYTDPLTGYTYVASNTDRPKFAMGANMLREAQAYVDNTYLPAKEIYEDIDPPCEPDDTRTACAEAREILIEAEHQVIRRTSFLDIIRSIGSYIDG